MSHSHHRHFLKDKEAKQLLAEVFTQIGSDLKQILPASAAIELIETEFGKIYLINGRPLLADKMGRILPTLVFTELLKAKAKVVVDMGAIPHVCNGADVMAPGIVQFQGKFTKGDIVSIVDEKYCKVIAVGESLLGADEAAKLNKGAIVKNIHHVGDAIWLVVKRFCT